MIAAAELITPNIFLDKTPEENISLTGGEKLTPSIIFQHYEDCYANLDLLLLILLIESDMMFC